MDLSALRETLRPWMRINTRWQTNQPAEFLRQTLDFLVPVDVLEALTGKDFLSALVGGRGNWLERHKNRCIICT